jgi:hypothetical protein
VSISFYPSYLRALFTDREREIDLLRQVADDLAAGRPRHLAFFGLRRIGKILLLRKHAVRILEAAPAGPVRPAHLDSELLVTSPELFSRAAWGWSPSGR